MAPADLRLACLSTFSLTCKGRLNVVTSAPEGAEDAEGVEQCRIITTLSSMSLYKRPVECKYDRVSIMDLEQRE